MGKPQNGGDRENDDYRDTIGQWADLAFDRVYEDKDGNFSAYDVLLRRTYKAAWDGEAWAIREMLAMIDANLKERELQKRYFDRRPSALFKTPRTNLYNADLALLILGICAVDNHSLDVVDATGRGSRKEALKELHPVLIEQWAVELAKSQPDAPELNPWELTEVEESTVSDDEEEVSQWRKQKDRLLDELMAVRGPGSSRFAPGVSGNPAGRPVKPTYSLLPYDGFFMEKVKVPYQNTILEMTRLDALMAKLVTSAGSENRKLARLLVPILRKLHELRWSKAKMVRNIVRIQRGEMLNGL